MSNESPRHSLPRSHELRVLRKSYQSLNRAALRTVPSNHRYRLSQMASLIACLILFSIFTTPLDAQSNDPSPERARPIAAAGVLDAARFPGQDWLAKVNAAAENLSRSNRGTIQIPDSISGNAATSGNIPSNVTLEFTGA